jgi:site-specific recombinase XerD
MKGGNEFSRKVLSEEAMEWIKKLHSMMTVRDYGLGSIKSYVNEMTLLFKYYHDRPVEQITQEDIEKYLFYIKTVHKVGRAKCRSVAQACSFFFKKVMQVDYVVPSNLYPRKQFILPNIMSQSEVGQLFRTPLNLKEYCAVGLLYGCGMRVSEVCNLKITDIDSANQRIKISQSKGSKDRFTLLPKNLLEKLRALYIEEGRPGTFLFTSRQTKRAYCTRSMQVVVNSAMAKAGFAGKGYTAHTLRHSFATHMLDSGSNIHIIKTLLGHSKLETTMIYLHLQQHTQLGIVSPLDQIVTCDTVAR